ncbi:MAG: DUF1835 domain-containing protein [Chitinophagaceae bacterium]|nr:DUF1835 domain-containing protein [Chitinophagaceae bacterium]
MIHIVFNEPDVDIMKEVIAMDESLTGDVILIRDDYAVGPLTDLNSDEGWQSRTDWWKTLINASHYSENEISIVDDRQTIAAILEKLETNEKETVWIWMGQNQHDVCGYYRIIGHLKKFQGRIMILYLNNLPFINEKGAIFYPSWLSEIQPNEFLKAKMLARPVTLSEFEIDPDEWTRICEENAGVRILEGGKKIIGEAIAFYDAEILKNLTADWQKAWRLVSNTLHRMKIKTGDVFIEWRIQNLIENEKIEIAGEIDKGWKNFDVRKPAKVPNP